MEKEETCISYRIRIMEIVKKIKDPEILVKIYTVAKTHLEIQRKREQGD